MSPEEITALLRHTFFTALEIAAPFLLLALVVGVLVSLFQSMAHMNEMTLSFIPKMLLVGLALAFLFPWVFKILSKFTTHLLIDQWEKIVSPSIYAF